MSRPLAVVLFDGLGLASLGLRLAGFSTIGVELNPVAHLIALQPDGYTPGRWRQEIYRALGNGVPVKMAEAFGIAVIEEINCDFRR